MSDDSNEGRGDAVADFAGRVFGSAVGALDILSIYLGDRLGWYRALAEAGQLSSTELARRTATQERYAREWLEQQAVSGILTVEETDDPDDADAAPVAASDRRFSLPAAHAEVLTDDTSLDYLAPSVRMFAASAAQLPQLLDAYRTGGGVSWQELGADAHESQGDMNRPWFDKRLAPALASVGSLHEVLSRPGAHIADVGCGHGWSTLALARAYPDARVEGFDVDQPSIEAARRHAAEAGLGEHVRFHLAGGEELAAEGRFDAAFVFEAVHDMPRPVEVLAAIRRAVRDDGQVVIMDEAVAERFAPDGDEVERYMYGFSLVVCLPDSLSSPGSVGTGTVMRQSTLEGYAREAGFSGIEELPIEGFASFRFTRLVR
ncbi:class I SAM-dependent methyltransferase [Agromyces albus]|uniref:Class I SAM-dependent methyltransferase n=1 Tax=Agromyces albus TaxID=205332 RepID=A0A4Q2L4W5_9MICO|nr:class I SAM-dependent methyltransferase [Agromyces albus]RXZ73274.1 class I SAM-dependent methyltransferase [Agromyces albus]